MAHQTTRRNFLKTSAVVAATSATVPGLSRIASAQAANKNGEIGIGVIGLGGRGNALAQGFQSVKGSKVVAVADPDEKHAGTAAKRYEAKSYRDLRELLEDPNVDAVAIATCNHWHCLAAIWAMEAGKDVYVEKPLSHTQWEGRQVVNAARKYNKIVQLGTQQRSDPMQAELKKFLHEDKTLGDIVYAQANRLGPRASIGKRSTPLPIPKEVDYDLWLGPAQDEPLYRDRFHYDWHWDWNTGSGEMGNWGVHVLDDVRNVAYQDSVKTPKRILSCGGRVVWNDAGDSPNVHYVFFDTGEFPTIIALSNLNKSPDKRGGWSSPADRKMSGPGSGYVVACEGGYLLGQRGKAVAVDRDGKEIRAFKGGDINALHKKNFIEAIQSRNHEDLNAEIAIGHDSTGWCNLANVASQVGGKFDGEATRSIAPDFEPWHLLLENMRNNLKPFGITINSDQIKMSPILHHNPETEQFEGDHAFGANERLKRKYRKGYEVPEIS